MNIISVKDRLPKHKQYVLAYFPDQPWGDRDALLDEHKWVVVKFIEGISEKTRDSLPAHSKRKRMYQTGDEWANNTVPYEWDTFGAESFFGQEAACWCELPSCP